MVKVTVIRDDAHKRILKCQEGNRIWYQMWINDMDMSIIEKYYLDLIDKKLIKAWWLRNLQIWYVFFYEKKGRKSNLVVGKENGSVYIKLRRIGWMPGMLGLWLLCVCMCGCGVLVCLYHESLKFPGTKRAERLR